MARADPIAGNQNYTNVVDLSRQLPTLSVARLVTNSASINSGDIVQLTHGDDPVHTTVFGTVTVANDGIEYYSFLVCPNSDFVDSGSPIQIGLGDISIPNISISFVSGGTGAIANNTTGGYVQGSIPGGPPT